MNIAELFVNLGVKGSEKTVGALSSMRTGLKETASMSLEAKAGILGAMYALEKMFAMSNAAGTGLMNFSASTGVSMRALQQYQWAAQQVGVSNEAVEGTFRSLQSAMTKIMTGEAVPKWFPAITNKLGIKAADIEKFAKEPQLLLQELQRLTGMGIPKALLSEMLKPLGLGNDMIAAIERNAFRPDVLKNAPAYSDKTAAALDKNHAQWSNLGTKIEMAFGNFNAKHGGEMVAGISGITDKVIKLSEALVKLGEKAHGFELLGMVFKGWTYIFEGLAAAIDALPEALDALAVLTDNKMLMKAVEGLGAPKKGEAKASDSGMKPGGDTSVHHDDLFGPKLAAILEKVDIAFATGGQDKSLLGIVKDIIVESVETKPETKPETPKLKLVPPPKTVNPVAPRPTVTPNAAPTGGAAVAEISIIGGVTPAVVAMVKQAEKPPVRSQLVPSPPAHVGGGGSTQNVEVSQTLNFHHDGTDAKKTGDSVKKAVKDAYRSQLQGAGG